MFSELWVLLDLLKERKMEAEQSDPKLPITIIFPFNYITVTLNHFKKFSITVNIHYISLRCTPVIRHYKTS